MKNFGYFNGYHNKLFLTDYGSTGGEGIRCPMCKEIINLEGEK